VRTARSECRQEFPCLGLKKEEERFRNMRVIKIFSGGIDEVQNKFAF
jgi:hypothetical protein